MVPCPRCEQDRLYHVRLVALNQRAVFCPECEALWLNEQDLGLPEFIDYGTFMKDSGVAEPDRPGEYEVLEPVMH